MDIQWENLGSFSTFRKTSIENVRLGLNLTCSDRETLSQIVRLGMKHDSLSPKSVQHPPNPDSSPISRLANSNLTKVREVISAAIEDFLKQFS